MVKLARVPADFLDRVAAARQLVVGKAGQALLTLSLDDGREAVEALGRCNDDLHRSWGLDVAARRALSRTPSVTSYEWAFEVVPYSNAYIAFVANISERGRPRDCRVVVTTGNRRMDETVCRVFRAGARLEPALDAQGRPVAAQYVTGVRFIVRD
jgi:hypothetical protein